MALPAFGVDGDEVEPVSPIAAEEATLVITSADDELLPRPEDDVEGQVADFLEQLPPGDAHKVVDALLGKAEMSSGGGLEVVVDDQSARIEESCEFLLRLLEFCSSAEQRQAVLQAWLRNNPREIPGKKSTSPTAASTDFLEVRRLQRLNSNLMTPAVAVSSKAADGRSKCFGREGDALETIVEFAPVREAFRSYDQHGCGRIDMASLAQVLKAGGLSDVEVARLLQEAAGVLSASESVDYEAFLEWTFKS
mmetsp:Transcript_6113/g.12602  ORF Transcript_6113/g.12602 Transcript_6113/m.12602 type:complete len:251 (-) Transcript_6113:105-857(-)